jgi:hypothetical protein
VVSATSPSDRNFDFLDLNSLLSDTKINNENMNLECNGNMFKSLNISLHESLFLEFVIILITLLCSLNILLL